MREGQIKVFLSSGCSARGQGKCKHAPAKQPARAPARGSRNPLPLAPVVLRIEQVQGFLHGCLAGALA